MGDVVAGAEGVRREGSEAKEIKRYERRTEDGGERTRSDKGR